MKLFKEKSPFAAVVITLESQDEVNQLYAACNHITVANALPVLSELWEELGEQKTDGFKAYHKTLAQAIKGENK